MARKDETKTKTLQSPKRNKSREVKPISPGYRESINGSGRKLRNKKGHKKYDSPFSIPGLDSLEIGVISDILVCDKMGFKSSFEIVLNDNHSNIDDIYGLLLSEIEHFNLSEEKLQAIHDEPNKMKRCGMYITEIYRAVNPDVYTIGFQDQSENPGVYYYVQYPEDLEYGTAQLVWMKKMFTYRKPLFEMVALMIQKMNGIVNVFDSDDYHFDYSVEYCAEMLHDYKCQKCKVGGLDDNDREHMDRLKEAFHSRTQKGEYTVFTKKILHQKGDLKDMMMCYRPKDELDKIVMDWLNLSFTIPDRGHSTFDFSNIVWDIRENFDGDPGMMMNLLGFIWDVDDAIFQEYDSMIVENINQNGEVDPMTYYDFEHLTKERIEEDREFVKNIVFFMNYSNDVCHKLKELMERVKNTEIINGSHKQRVSTDTQLSCFPK